jgi:hypothetical protein
LARAASTIRGAKSTPVHSLSRRRAARPGPAGRGLLAVLRHAANGRECSQPCSSREVDAGTIGDAMPGGLVARPAAAEKPEP